MDRVITLTHITHFLPTWPKTETLELQFCGSHQRVRRLSSNNTTILCNHFNDAAREYWRLSAVHISSRRVIHCENQITSSEIFYPGQEITVTWSADTMAYPEVGIGFWNSQQGYLGGLLSSSHVQVIRHNIGRAQITVAPYIGFNALAISSLLSNCSHLHDMDIINISSSSDSSKRWSCWGNTTLSNMIMIQSSSPISPCALASTVDPDLAGIGVHFITGFG